MVNDNTKEKVLIVDGDSAHRWVFGEAVRHLGYWPLEAATCAEASEILTLENPKVVLLDIKLPDGSGLDLLSQLKHLRRDLLVIVISPTPYLEHRISALRRGAYSFLEKPVKLEQLREVLGSGLGIPADRKLTVEVANEGGIASVREQRWAIDQLRELSVLLDHVQDAVLIRDLDDRIVFWNKGAERLYGWTAEEAQGRHVRELLYPRDARAFSEATRSTYENGSWSEDLQQWTKDGMEITAHCHWILVQDESGAPRSIFVINSRRK